MSDLLTDRDIAAEFGIGFEQVQYLCKTRQWPHLRVGRLYKFTPEQVEQIKTLCTVAPKATDVTWGRKRRGSRSA